MGGALFGSGGGGLHRLEPVGIPRSPRKWTLTGKFWIAVGGCHCNFAKSEKGFFGAQPDESFRPNKP